jgi:exonuclease SbcD
MIRFIHTADIHFGMENYGKIDPKTGIHSRLLDFSRAFNFCVDTAIEQQVDFFLFCGDAYKTAHPSQTQQKLLFQGLLKLYQAKIPVIIIIGNHDNPLSYGKAHALDIFGELPLDGFHVIAKPTILKLQTQQEMVQIVGIPWPTRNTISVSNKYLDKSTAEITTYISTAVTRIIQEYAQKLNPSEPAILAGHLTVSSGIFSGSEKRAIYGTDPLFLPSQLAIPPFDYVALGHLHRHQNLNLNGHPPLVYSGSLERIDFGERNEEKGFCLVTIDQKKTTYEFIKTPTRPFLHIEFTMQPNRSQTEQMLEELIKYDLHDAVVKILYHLPPGYKDAVDLKKVQEACSSAMYIVSVIPIRTPDTRERRLNLEASSDLPTLLGAYFDAKPELKVKKQNLIDKALLLLEEQEQQET